MELCNKFRLMRGYNVSVFRWTQWHWSKLYHQIMDQILKLFVNLVSKHVFFCSLFLGSLGTWRLGENCIDPFCVLYSLKSNLNCEINGIFTSILCLLWSKSELVDFWQKVKRTKIYHHKPRESCRPFISHKSHSFCEQRKKKFVFFQDMSRYSKRTSKISIPS